MGKTRTFGISQEMLDWITKKASEVAAEQAIEISGCLTPF